MREIPAPNERFYESGGVCPHKHLCEFSSASPARTFVSTRLHKAATTLGGIWKEKAGNQTVIERKRLNMKR
jgi:hypothetical protein